MRWVLIAFLMCLPAGARAAQTSWVTLGFGSHTVVGHNSGMTSTIPGSVSVGQGIELRFRFLKALGIEMSYDVASDAGRSDVNVFAPSFKLSALVAPIITKRFTLFLLLGLGSSSLPDLFSVSGDTTSYHVGSGFEVGITKHWIVCGDVRFNLPAYTQVLRRDPHAFDNYDNATRYYNFDSWQFSVGARYYL